MNNSDNASNILIRNLSKEDNDMLTTLREITYKKSNSQAVMEAAHKYLDLLERHEETNSQLRKALTKIERITIEHKGLQKKITEYFAHIEKEDVMKNNLISASTRPIGQVEQDAEDEEDEEETDY